MAASTDSRDLSILYLINASLTSFSILNDNSFLKNFFDKQVSTSIYPLIFYHQKQKYQLNNYVSIQLHKLSQKYPLQLSYLHLLYAQIYLYLNVYVYLREQLNRKVAFQLIYSSPIFYSLNQKVFSLYVYPSFFLYLFLLLNILIDYLQLSKVITKKSLLLRSVFTLS
ncbi:MAG: hypothetical protein OMM_05869 [Candidatus Magnetoglobus multicellularis str. Araruama]|uniref:Transmembrane protein n=1 Tax=Candidatus Magnetoglobus multicellularis str. Araruama TaxID=890399 RepID=A0A1V1NTK1_9BACT|nr:MAG: hypothetical protein OMM_05869 [Candidatus Magnetoglobus multicellularis str. Araruama]